MLDEDDVLDEGVDGEDDDLESEDEAGSFVFNDDYEDDDPDKDH